MEVKITSVYDEGALTGTQMIGAKGFAVFIEAEDMKILFDTGKRGRYLLHNMLLLHIEPKDIDKVVISHGHGDHTGGLEDLLKEREVPLNIYAPPSAIGIGKKRGHKPINIPEELSEKADVYEIREWMEIADRIFVSLPIDIGDGMTESFIVILTAKGPAVISACSHMGVGKVMEVVKKRFGSYPHTYVGGVHLGKKDKEKAKHIAYAFSEGGCSDLHLNHCTGLNGMTYLRTDLGLKGVNDFYVGSVLSLKM